MPSWENIEDASPNASRVWFSRAKETDAWMPLRKKDSQTLNDLLEQIHTSQSQMKKLGVYIEEGRCTATLNAEKPSTGIVTYNFVRGQRELCSAIWFRKEDGKEPQLHPIFDNDDDAQSIEDLYQKAINASSSLGAGISSVVNESVTLSDESAVVITKSGGSLKLVLKQKGWFGGVCDIQRGYGEYSVVGEDDELALRPVGHLCFVIHGVGEAFFSQMENSQMSIIDQMNTTRIELHKKQVAEWKKACQRALKEKEEEPHPPRRIEVIPIEWFNRLHDSSTTLMKSLRSTTLQTIPALRAIANDIIFDVLLYLTPNFCESVLECVTDQICDHHAAFCTIHPDFPRDKCSLVGHSLGSVISWDLLSILKDKQGDCELSRSVRGIQVATNAFEIAYQEYANPGEENANKPQHGTWGPTLTKPMIKTIPFVPDCTIFLGSPLGIFLTLRGAHAVFDEQRKVAVEQALLLARSSTNPSDHKIPAASPFTLPTKSLYNIFHASDPVAYRIEPLLLSQDLEIEDLPPPVYLTAPGKDVRLHVKARQIGEEVAKTLAGGQKRSKIGKSAWSSLVDSTLTALANSNPAAIEGGDSTSGSASRAITTATLDGDNEGEPKPEWPPTYPLGSPSDLSQKERRVDYSFQPGVVENEYLNAIMAHSSYFGNPDLIDFLISRLSEVDDSMDKDKVS